MASFTRQFLSGSSDGLQIAIAATSTPGTIIHTANATAKDELYIYAVNINSSDTKRILTVEWGGTATKDKVRIEIKADKGLVLIIPGTALSNSKVVRAFSDVANEVNIQGWVNRIS